MEEEMNTAEIIFFVIASFIAGLATGTCIWTLYYTGEKK